MTSTTLSAGRSAKQPVTGVHCQTHLFAFSGAANTDADTIQIAELPPRAEILNVVLRTTDLDAGTDVEIDIGLNPAPGGTTADPDIIADGLIAFVTTGGQKVELSLPPAHTAGVITAGAGVKTHAELDSIVYLTLVDQGDATSGTIYSQVWYSVDTGYESDVVVNS